MKVALLLFMYALSVSSAELQRGHSYTAVATAPAGSVVEVRAPQTPARGRARVD